jgi:hypothetical protein
MPLVVKAGVPILTPPGVIALKDKLETEGHLRLVADD